MQKTALRKLYKQKRQELTPATIEELQQNIYDQVFQLDFSSVNYLHIFLPIKRQIEINTYPIIDFLRTKNKQLVISKSDFKTHTLQHFIFEEQTQLIENKYGIPEPENAQEIDEKSIDLVFVPLLISDKQKYRVGYGKGFYDRFLSNCRTDVQTIGLNFFQPIEKITDINQFDVSLQHVICPK